jgi:tetratricopeptide (TPR) repeat protein
MSGCFAHSSAWRSWSRLGASLEFERVAVEGSAEAPDALCNLANTLVALERYDEAERHYARSLELRLEFWEARLNRAIAYARRGRRAEANAELERCLDAKPDYLAALWNLAVLRAQEEGGNASVLDRVDRAIAADPESPRIRMLLGDLFLLQRRFEDAVTAYRAVIEVDAGSSDAWANLGRALDRLERREEARAAVERALAIEPGSELALEVKRELTR